MVDLGRLRKLDLGLLGRLLHTLQRHPVLGQVDAVVVLYFLEEVVDDPLVPVVSAQVGVAVGGLDVEHALGDLEDRDVEGAAAEVEDQDGLLGFLVQPVGQGGGGGLGNQAQDLEAGDLAGFFGRLALGVAEVCGDGDDRLGDPVAQVGLGVPLELHEDLSRDLLRLPGLVVDFRVQPVPICALDGADRAIRVGNCLALGYLADQDLAGLGERHDRRRGAVALGVGDDDRLPAFQDAYHRVGGSEIDSYCFWH